MTGYGKTLSMIALIIRDRMDWDMTTEHVCPDCGLCEAHGNSKIYDKCWTGFHKVPGKKRGEKGSCKKNEGAGIPVSEEVESIMAGYIKILASK
jgi:hypothetical protein